MRQSAYNTCSGSHSPSLIPGLSGWAGLGTLSGWAGLGTLNGWAGLGTLSGWAGLGTLSGWVGLGTLSGLSLAWEHDCYSAGCI